jgi:Carbohydrate binding domain
MNNKFDELASIKPAGPGLKRLLCVVCGLLSSASIQAQPNLVLNGGFETGDLTGWTSGGANVDTDPDEEVHSGAYGAFFAGGVVSLVYVFQTVDTIPGYTYSISTWVKGTSNRPFPRHNEFHVTWDGTNVFDAVNNSAGPYWDLDWTNVQLTAVASSQHTVLQFGFQDDGIQGGSLGLDDVAVVAIPPPVFLPGGLMITNGQVALTWESLSGVVYQLQYTTSLNPPAWTDLGIPITATAFTTTAYDSPGANPQRFYRVALLP